MSANLTLPEVRRCLERIVVLLGDGQTDVAEVEARLALHLLTGWTDADLEATQRAMRRVVMNKNLRTADVVLRALDPQRARVRQT